MIEGLQPYLEYKESQLPWLGRCPSHWALRRTKILFHERVQKGFPNEPLLAATQTKGVVRKEDYETRTVTAQKDFHLLKLVETGDYVISLRSFQGGIEYAHQRGIISPAYTILKPGKSAKSGFYTHFFKARPFVDSLSLFVTGIREGQNVDYERLSRAEMPLPPEDEQVAIVRFLDHANRKIDGLIRAKRKLIGLLNEQKQAIIHRAVTRGLNPNVPLKPSGIPWLGDIPQHWDVMRLKFLSHIKTGGRDTAHRNDNGQFPFYVRSQTVERINSFSFDGEAVLTAGDGAGVGKVFHYANGKFDYHQRVYKFSHFRRITGHFFFEYLRSTLRFEALDASAKSTVDSLRLPLLQNFPTLIPPLIEQQAIVAWIEREAAPLNTAIARTEREITLMQEYRTRLTADVVTGKLDVRAAAEKLPDLTDQPQTELDESSANVEVEEEEEV